uniref:Coactosin-like protein n=1 Tax=Corvus moneduloides TaxID=1196302 RepID=A0A8U7MUV2_CORMO
MRECSWAALGARQGEIAALERGEPLAHSTDTLTQTHRHTQGHTAGPQRPRTPGPAAAVTTQSPPGAAVRGRGRDGSPAAGDAWPGAPRCSPAPAQPGAPIPAPRRPRPPPLAPRSPAPLCATSRAPGPAPGPAAPPAAAPSRAPPLPPSPCRPSAAAKASGRCQHSGGREKHPRGGSAPRRAGPSPAAPAPPSAGYCITAVPPRREGPGRGRPSRAIGGGGGGGGTAAGRGARLGSARSARCGSSGGRGPPSSAPLRAAPLPFAPMATKIDKEACREAYNLVRDDATEVNWVTFKYNGSTIVPGDQGVDYETFKRKCTDDVRLFGFVRFTTGDAMSKRVKFALITWIGEDVSGLQRAKTGTDKTLVKEVVQNFAKEFVISDHKELDEDYIKNELKKAGGANYDAQTE